MLSKALCWVAQMVGEPRVVHHQCDLVRVMFVSWAYTGILESSLVQV